MVDKRHAWAAVAERREAVWGAEPIRPAPGIASGLGTLAVETVSDSREFERLGPDWSELLQASERACPFLSWEWQYSWWKHLAGRRTLNLLTVRRGGRLLAIAPLARRPPQRRRLLPFSALEFLGTGAAGSDYLDLIVRRGEEEPAVTALAAHLARHAITLELAQVDAASSHVQRLAIKLEELGWWQLREQSDVCPFVSLAGHSWATYFESLGGAHRYNFRRRLRNLHKRHNVEFVQACDDAERREMLQALAGLHQKRWNALDVQGAFSEVEVIRFHDEWTRLAMQHRWLRIYILRLDGVPVASLYGFRYGDTFYFYQSGFDPDHAKSSVGMLVLGLAIESAIGEGVSECDLLHGDEAYKFRWTRDTRKLVRFNLCPPNFHGKIYRQALILRQGMKKMLLERLPKAEGQ